jgi:hypothetical protein
VEVVERNEHGKSCAQQLIQQNLEDCTEERLDTAQMHKKVKNTDKHL